MRILGERPHLLVPGAVKRVFYLPSNFKRRKNREVTGVAQSGEISDKGLVSVEEDWEGRQAVQANTATLHLTRLPDGRVVNKTREQLIEEGLIRIGQGPTGVELIHGGIVA